MGRKIVSPTQRATRSIVNSSSSGSSLDTIQSMPSSKSVTSGAVTANTLVQVLSVTGSGYLTASAIQCVDATARTLRLQIIIDGVTAYDATTAAISSNLSGIIAVGLYNGTNSIPAVPGVRFNQSIVINTASSLTETGKQTYFYAYNTE